MKNEDDRDEKEILLIFKILYENGSLSTEEYINCVKEIADIK
jgi:hypothetical protein